MSIQPSGKHRSSGRSRRQWLALARLVAVAVLVGAGLYVALRQPIPTPAGAPAAYTSQQATDASAADPVLPPSLAVATPSDIPTAGAGTGPTTTAPPVAAEAPPRPTAPVVSTTAKAASTPCQPVWFTLSDLGIDTGVVRLGLTPTGDLGTPRDADKTRAGWFPSVLAGSARGTVLMDGHTYHDNSAIFTMSFERQIRTEMVITLSCSDGHAFRYRIAEIVPDLSPGAFRTLVQDRALYAADGPPQLVLITCTDYVPASRVWLHRVVLVATPVG